MKTVIGILIFLIVLFIYLHVQFQLKISNDLEMYDLNDEYTTKEKFEEICDLRQPVIFSLENIGITKEFIESKYGTCEIKVRNVKESEYNSLPLSISNATKLFENDTNETYISENNTELTGLLKEFKKINKIVQPSMTCQTTHDLMFGSAGVETPLRYNLSYRNFYTTTEGSARIKLFPPVCDRYFEPCSDYENFEFKSSFSAWNLPENIKDKVNCIEFVLTPNKAVYIPAYWWYSIKFDKNTTLASFNYKTYMNYLAISPNIFMYFLQNMNIKREIVKKANISGINETIS